VRGCGPGPPWVLALDDTKVAANAADKANRTLDKVEAEVAEILRQAAEADQREDLEHGHARGDELPAELARRTGRLARLRQAKARLEAEAAERQRRYQQRVAELAAAARAKGRKPRAHIKPRHQDEAPNPKATANITDPDSRFLHTRNGTVQGYNAQAVVTEGQVVAAAELTQHANDLQQLWPMLQAVDQTLAAADIQQRPGTLLADSGSWSIANLTSIPDAPELLIWPSKTGRIGKPRKDGKPSASRSQGLRAAMFTTLSSDDGKARYATRKQTVEPVFGQLNEQQGARRFLHSRAGRPRGRVEAAVRHPQPAQALAPHPPPSRSHSNHHLNGGQRRPCLPRRPLPATARRCRQARHQTRQRASPLAAASGRGLSATHC
jgi:hypothetical protein